jgi:hypothetical protein
MTTYVIYVLTLTILGETWWYIGVVLRGLMEAMMRLPTDDRDDWNERELAKSIGWTITEPEEHSDPIFPDDRWRDTTRCNVLNESGHLIFNGEEMSVALFVAGAARLKVGGVDR